MWGIVGALQSVLKAKYNITAIMLYFRTAERALLHLPCWKSEQGHGKEIFVQKYPLAVPSRHDRREYSGIMHNQTADKVPIRYRREYQHGNEQRTNSEKVKMKHERSKRKLKIELRKNSEKTQRTEGEQWKMSVYSVQIRAFLGVFCVRYNYTPYAFTTLYRATESHYNAF